MGQVKVKFINIYNSNSFCSRNFSPFTHRDRRDRNLKKAVHRKIMTCKMRPYIDGDGFGSGITQKIIIEGAGQISRS